MKYALLLSCLLTLPLCAASCTQGGSIDDAPRPQAAADLQSPPVAVTKEGVSRLVLALPADPSPGLQQAARDLDEAVEQITGLAPGVQVVTWEETTPTQEIALIRVSVVPQQDASSEASQSYRMVRTGFAPPGTKGLLIEGASEVGAMYGIYELIASMGVRYHHPEETFFPKVDPATFALPWEGVPLASDEAVRSTPRFELRGFHEHTQHPIPMSDYYLRPEPEFRPYVRRYLHWLARNRQNAASWHMLKTVALEPWKPYVSDIISEAHSLGIRVGMVTSFVDEQQNNFKIIVGDRRDAQGTLIPDETQIRDVLTELHGLGFDFLTFQIGSSEFTKPLDADVLRWLEVAATTATSLSPNLRLYTWIHTTCSLKSETGDYFYHLPGQSSTVIGAWVHTVMFHTLEHPAPVYDCDNFHQQRDFMLAQQGKREQVYFPESAWWLGFDNNMPLALPLTGWTRAWDIQQELKGKQVSGHITFTTGREWNYWQYDHHLTRATWDDAIGWEEYLAWIAPMYGDKGPAVTELLGKWALLQKKHILEDNPLIYFYLAGELEQDEIGEKAGIVARRPKISFQEIVDYDNREFEAWKIRDFDMLSVMRQEYAALLATLDQPPAPTEDTPLPARLLYETWVGLMLHVKRLDHAILLYTGAQEVRQWVTLYESGTPYDDPRRQQLTADAQGHLADAQAISAEAQALILSQEASYRYPLDILIAPKPQTLTTYPIGYLEQAHTAFFWHRRDAQLEQLIKDGFAEDLEVWAGGPQLLFAAKGSRIKMTKPDNVVASSVLASFIPQLLIGFKGSLEDGSTDATMLFGQDHNENFKPDEGSESAAPLAIASRTATAMLPQYTFIARSTTGSLLGQGLKLAPATFALTFKEDEKGATLLERLTINGQVSTMELVGLLRAAAPDGLDEESAINLIKEVFGIKPADTLPEKLDIEFLIRPTPAVVP